MVNATERGQQDNVLGAYDPPYPPSSIWHVDAALGCCDLLTVKWYLPSCLSSRYALDSSYHRAYDVVKLSAHIGA